VNGSPRTAENPQGTGIQVRKRRLRAACSAAPLPPQRAQRLRCAAAFAFDTASPTTTTTNTNESTQGAFNLSNFENGLLATAFLVGLLVASPIFSEACKHFSAFRLIGIGMLAWTLAVAGCGLAFNWASIFTARMFVGVGEASFVALATPFIGARLCDCCGCGCGLLYISSC
jgi:MFS family permease